MNMFKKNIPSDTQGLACQGAHFVVVVRPGGHCFVGTMHATSD